NSTSEPQVRDANLGTLTRTWQMSGSWRGFDLAFKAGVDSGSLLRVGIVPVVLAPNFAPTRPAAEGALVTLTLDGTSTPPTMTLDVEGLHVAAPFSATQRSFCNGPGFCPDDMQDVRVVVQDDGVRATLTGPKGEKVELRGPTPSSPTMPASRLVF